MTHHGKAALHRLALRRTEKVGDTGVTLGSILDYVASLEAEIERMRSATQASDLVQRANSFGNSALWEKTATRLFLSLKSPFGNNAQMRDADIRSITKALMDAVESKRFDPVGYADPTDIRVTGRTFDVRRTANGRYTTALFLAETTKSPCGGGE